MVSHTDECLVSYSISIPALCLASAAGTISAVFDPQTAAFPKDIPSQSGLWINESPMPPWGTSLAHSLLTSWIIMEEDRKSTRLNSSHLVISYAVFCLKKKSTTTWHGWRCTPPGRRTPNSYRWRVVRSE